MNNSWFRFYNDALNDQKVQTLSLKVFKFWINLLCVSSKNDGKIPELSSLAFLLRETEKETQKALDELIAAGLVDEVNGQLEPHNWDKRQYKSDNSSNRVKDYRERKSKQQCNVTSTVTATPPDNTDTETDNNPPNPLGKGEQKKSVLRSEGTNPRAVAEREAAAVDDDLKAQHLRMRRDKFALPLNAEEVAWLKLYETQKPEGVQANA